MNENNIVLEMKGIVKRYGDLVANDGIDLTLKKGEVLAVIGENGAGKTTLMKVLYGMEHPNSGSIFINGKETAVKSPTHAIENGIGMVQQHFMLFDPFTVAENVVYGKEPRKGLFFDIETSNRAVAELSKKHELPLDPKMKIKGMPVGLRQRVEILKVLYQNAEIIIFDEPTAVLTPQEVRDLLKTIRQLADSGKSIIIITHKLNEVMEVADRAMVMRLGKLIATTNIADTSIEELGFMMVGRRIVDADIPQADVGDDVLRVEDLNLAKHGEVPVIDHLSLHVRKGEIVGIAGVSGNGQSELAQCLFGLTKATSGKITVNGQDVTNKPVKRVRQAGSAMIPEDRYLWGSASLSTISETAIMAHHRKPEFSKNGLLKPQKINAFAEKLVKDFSVKTDSIRQKTGSLSGGNAQKLIAAREISQNTPLLIASEPTRGVDIGAMEFIHDRLLEKRAGGDGVLLISSELSELMKLSDRIYVMYAGRINGEFTRDSVTEEELGLLMAGGSKNA